MISGLLTPLDCAAVLLSFYFLKAFISSRKKKLPLPPGPRGWPILGNVLDIPRSLAWVKYKALGDKYGDIMSFSVPGQTVVVINSIRIAKELLDKRGQTWSNRPTIPLIHLMEVDNWNVVMKPNDETHRLERRIADHGLRPSALTAYHSTQIYRVHEMLRAFLHTPDKFVHHIDFMLTGIILSVAYGYNITRTDDPYLAKSRALNSAIVASIGPSASLVNIFPSLKFLPTWFPGMGRARDIARCRQLGQEIRNEPFDLVKEEIRNGTAKSSLTRDNLLTHGDMDILSEDDRISIMNVAGTLYEAAVDTTGTLLATFILVQALYPEIQRRAQAQLDSVVGRERLPGFQDRDTLPYIEALCMELVRWRPSSPLGIPHATTVDDVYEDYFIPKGSMIIANAWAMLHDPAKYPDPESFIPERFLTPSGQLKEDPDLTVAFGFGRRICPGRFLASSITFITVASVLSAFNIGHTKDEAGIEIPVKAEFTVDSGMLSVPLPFRCSVTPRDEKAVALIKLTAENDTENDSA